MSPRRRSGNVAYSGRRTGPAGGLGGGGAAWAGVDVGCCDWGCSEASAVDSAAGARSRAASATLAGMPLPRTKASPESPPRNTMGGRCGLRACLCSSAMDETCVGSTAGSPIATTDADMRVTPGLRMSGGPASSPSNRVSLGTVGWACVGSTNTMIDGLGWTSARFSSANYDAAAAGDAAPAQTRSVADRNSLIVAVVGPARPGAL